MKKEQEIVRKLEYREYLLSGGIKLRRLKESDKDDMYEYTSNEECCFFLKWGPHTRVRQASEFIRKRLQDTEVPADLLWGIELTEESKLIGVVRVYHIDFDNRQAEISYILNPRYAGKGYATMAVRQVMDVCFRELNLEKVIAFYADANRKSEKLLERCGAVKDTEWKEQMEIKGRIYQIRRCFVLRRKIL